MSIDQIWPYIEKGGVIFLLFLNVYLLLKGEVIPKGVVEKILTNSDKRAEIIAVGIREGMTEAIEKAVRNGILSAMNQLNHNKIGGSHD